MEYTSGKFSSIYRAEHFYSQSKSSKVKTISIDTYYCPSFSLKKQAIISYAYTNQHYRPTTNFLCYLVYTSTQQNLPIPKSACFLFSLIFSVMLARPLHGISTCLLHQCRLKKVGQSITRNWYAKNVIWLRHFFLVTWAGKMK